MGDAAQPRGGCGGRLRRARPGRDRHHLPAADRHRDRQRPLRFDHRGRRGLRRRGRRLRGRTVRPAARRTRGRAVGRARHDGRRGRGRGAADAGLDRFHQRPRLVWPAALPAAQAGDRPLPARPNGARTAMTRTLALITGVGAGLAVFCFVLASVVGGGALLHGDWHRSWQVRNGSTISIGHVFTPDVDGGGPSETREIAWSGADSLDVDIPADITFTQAPGPAKLVITGPKGTVDQVEASGSDLDYRDEPTNAQRVKIVMTAPDVRSFSLSGDETLVITGFSQDELALDISGTGKITAQGKAR